MASFRGTFDNGHYGGNRYRINLSSGNNSKELYFSYSLDRLGHQCGMKLMHGCYPNRKPTQEEADAVARDLRTMYKGSIGKLLATAVKNTNFYHLMNESDLWVRGSLVRNPNSSNYICAFELDMTKPLKETEEREEVA